MLPRAAEEALSDAFSGKLLLRRKEEFCKKYTSKCRKKARQPTFASNKNRSGTTRVSEPGERYKREMAGDRKGRRYVRTTGVGTVGGWAEKIKREMAARVQVLNGSRAKG
ncbi:hypothetical protein [Bacteroides hominis]|uniref:hypothetical protein n=1 Tax=Bacteroides hominis TaxID=2763023 RepID=UPI001C9B3E7B|nr:hypothetical protein [Bacteroides hominis (ex Liu et al. 2022)]